MPKQGQKPPTRQRLLEVAAEVFAEHGYRGARLREICDRAEANVAAVNYHFRDKQSLYDEVLRYAFFSLTGPSPTDWDIDEAAPATERLHAFIRTFLAQLLSEGRLALYAKLVAKECIEPTHALERVIEEGMQPQVDQLLGIVREILGSGASDVEARRCVASTLGQCLFYYFVRPVILRVSLEDEISPQSVAPLAEHIARFSLSGIRAMTEAR